MRVRSMRLTSLLLATTALGVGAAQVAADFEARSQVQRLIARHEGVAVGSIAVDVLRGHIVLRGVTSKKGSLKVSIGTLTLPMTRTSFSLVTSASASPFDDAPEAPQASPAPGPVEKSMPKPEATAPAAPKPPAPAEAKTAPTVPGTATAENVTITSGSTSYRIKHIELTGTSLSNADVASLLDQASAEPIDSRVRKLNATSIAIPEVVIEDNTPGSERSATMRQIALSGVVAGRITAGSVDGTSFAVKSGDDKFDGTTGAVKAVGIDLPQVVHVTQKVRTDDAEPIKPIYDSISVNTIKVNNAKGGVFTIGSVKETNLKGRPFKIDLQKAQKTGTGKLSDADQAALYDDMTHSFAVGTIEMNDIVGNGTDPKGPQSFSLANFTMSEFANGKIGAMSMHDFLLTGPGVKVALGGIETGPFDLPPPKKADAAAGASRAMMPGSLKVDLTKLDIAVTPEDAAKASNPVNVKIGHAGFVSDGETGDIPRSSKLSIDNVAFDIPPGNDKAQPLVDMGYSHLDISAGMATAYDPAKQELVLQELAFKGVKMGSVSLGAQLVNVTKGIVSPNKEVAKASMVAVLVKGLALEIVNEGIVDRLLEWKSKQDGMTVANEKAFVVDLFTNKLPSSIKSANMKIIGDAVAKFIENPKNLRIQILSKNGLGVGAMSMLDDPALLLDTLEVKASANQ